MEYKDIRENLEEMMNDNYKDFIKALVSIEKGVNNEKALEEVYVLYMNNDTTGLLSDDFDYMIDDMKEQGKIDKKKEAVHKGSASSIFRKWVLTYCACY